jgi:hypothetical protein
VTPQVRQNGLQVAVGFTGVRELLARREVDLERLFPCPPVLEARGVREHVAGGDEVQTRISFEVPLRGVFRQRRVETDHSVLAQFHDGVGEHRLADGGYFGSRVVVEGFL